MATPKKPAKKNPLTNKLKVLKYGLKEQITFLERQATLPYTLRGQADALLAQIAVLKKYLK